MVAQRNAMPRTGGCEGPGQEWFAFFLRLEHLARGQPVSDKATGALTASIKTLALSMLG